MNANLSHTSEFSVRRRTLASQLAEHKADALLTSFLPNVRYLTGYTGSNGMLLLDAAGGATFFTDPRYQIQAAAEVDCRVKVSKGPLLPDVVAAVTRQKIRRLGFEKSRTTYDQYEFLQSSMPLRSTLEPVSGLIEKQRMIKSEQEIERIRRSVELNSSAFEAALAKVRPGKTTEAELAAEIEHLMRKGGAERPAFETIVAAADRSALPHAQPSQRLLGKNELLLIDMGATRDGYASDMTRMAFGGRPGKRIKEMYKAVLDAQLAAIDSVRPGINAGSVDQRARKVLQSYKLDKFFIHSTGHGLGLEIHEPPRIGKRDKTRIEEGMAITIEPGVYLEGYGGIRIEDTVVVTRTGCDVLTPTSKELREIA